MGINPNNCYDGGVYRSLNGPNVSIDQFENKNLSIDGKTLVSCQVGNTTSCVGTTYNNYTCELNFSKLGGQAAQIVLANIDHATVGLELTYENAAKDKCSFMHCTVVNTLICSDGICEIKPVFSGWNE